MSEKKTALDTLYFVNNSDANIGLEIITGPMGQTSTITASIDGLFEESANGRLSKTIGSNTILNGKILIIACTISDTSRETNYTELIVRLNGGISYKDYTLYGSVENEGGSIEYACVIRFFKPY